MTSRAVIHVADCLYVDPHPQPRFVMVAQMDAKMIGADLSRKLDKMGLPIGVLKGIHITHELEKLIDADDKKDMRQYALVTYDDEYFQYSGNKCCFMPDFPEATQGHQVQGAGDRVPARYVVAVQGNIVTQTTLGAMMSGFQEDPLKGGNENLRGGNSTRATEKGIEEDMALRASLLGLRVMSGLKAGQEAGGDVRHGPRMIPSYASAAFVLVKPDAEPFWTFYPEGAPDGKGSGYSYMRNSSLVGTTHECLDKIHSEYLNHEKANLESHGCYSQAATPRWPWVPRHGSIGLYHDSDASYVLISKHVLTWGGFFVSAFIFLVCIFSCRKLPGFNRSGTSSYGTMAKSQGN